ncbi:MAG: sigma-70 family RNA polymerase sigma factor, partial [Solirubrobacterales bacterium]|nr:sigma-70 family RNA polymerase sigma factor [Solirubrobacterales bacterium]
MSTTAIRAPRQTPLALSRLGDESLAGRAAAGDEAAFTALYERYFGPLLGYTRSILRNPEDAYDATQTALEHALRAMATRDPDRPLRPWLYKIAHNEAINIMRRRTPQTELRPAFEPKVPGPEVDAEQRGRLEQLVDDLQSLPERQRGALVMRELNGLSYDDIGAALGLTKDAARRAVFDARTALHDAVDGRATACVSVRHKLSDGDRRSLRQRSIRAHLRSCNDCASFQRSIGARRADLHLLAPWASGVAVVSAIGASAVGSGG